MNIDFNNLNSLIRRTTARVIRETLDSHLGGDDEERRRQERMAQAVNKRGLNASDNSSDVDEAEEEVEEEEVEVEEKETGVPEDTDASTKPDGKKREDRSGGKGTADSPKLKTPSERQLKKATVGSVIDKLNAMRGGRSLKDAEVKKSFKQYFDSLTQKERETLLVFLTGMAQILAGTADGEQALDPGDVGLRVKGSVEKSSTVKDQEIKSDQEKQQHKKARPGSAAAPIVVGESQNKHKIRKLLEAYRRYQ